MRRIMRKVHAWQIFFIPSLVHGRLHTPYEYDTPNLIRNWKHAKYASFIFLFGLFMWSLKLGGFFMEEVNGSWNKIGK